MEKKIRYTARIINATKDYKLSVGKSKHPFEDKLSSDDPDKYSEPVTWFKITKKW